MLRQIHSSHFEVEKCQQRARDVIFWPGMSADIQKTVSQCPTCSQLSNSNPKEPMMSHDIPSRPWQKVATDIFHWNSNNYLVTVDYYSRFFEIDKFTSTTSSAVIRRLSVHFARHGIPEKVVSDNGPQFSSDEFASFAKTWDFKHITSSPKYPPSNGLAEKYVQICKNILEKARLPGNNPLLSILEYRPTPVDNLASPSQMLMGRRLCSILPISSQCPQPKVIRSSEVQSRCKTQQNWQKFYKDKCAQPLQPLKKGDKVFIQPQPGERKWKSACITNTGNHRSNF